LLALARPSKSNEDAHDASNKSETEVSEGETEQNTRYQLCQKDLLYAYGIENPGYIQSPGMLCKHRTSESCCSRTAESQLLEKWINTDRARLSQNIDGYYHILEGIFDYYEDIILFAKYIHLNPYSSEKCVQSSRNLIFNYMKKNEIIDFMKMFRTTMEYLKETRKGFYCSLCDVDYQKYFDTEAKKIIMATSFCQKLVENTVEAVYERVNRILPILQDINVLLECDEEHESQDENALSVSDQITFGIDQDDQEELNHCYNLYTEFGKPELYMIKCLHYCRDFRFSLGSIVYEGSLAKISFLYDKVLKKKFNMTDPVFAIKDESRSFIAEDGVETQFFYRQEFLFTDVTNVFFTSRYKANDFRTFETVFEEDGIKPMEKGAKSKFVFGHEDFLELLPENPYASVKVLMSSALLMFLTLLR
jgi:hypothetical protein